MTTVDDCKGSFKVSSIKCQNHIDSHNNVHNIAFTLVYLGRYPTEEHKIHSVKTVTLLSLQQQVTLLHQQIH